MKDALPSRGIPMVFLFMPETNVVEMIVVNDLFTNQNLMFSLKLQKKNQIERKMLMTFWQHVKASTKTSLVNSFK